MAMSNVERQRAYRERMKLEGARFSTIVSKHSAAALERLARHHGLSKKDMIEQLISDADEAVLKSMTLSSRKTKEYIAGRTS